MPKYGFTRSERQMAGRGTTLTQSQFDKLSAEREARMEADILSSRGAYVRDPNTGKKVAAGSKDHAIIIEAEKAAERVGMTGSSKKNAFMALYKEQRQEEEELTKDLNDLKLQYETYRTKGQVLSTEKTRKQLEKYQKSVPERYEEIYSIAGRLVNDGLLDQEQAVFFIIDKLGGDTKDIFATKDDEFRGHVYTSGGVTFAQTSTGGARVIDDGTGGEPKPTAQMQNFKFTQDQIEEARKLYQAGLVNQANDIFLSLGIERDGYFVSAEDYFADITVNDNSHGTTTGGLTPEEQAEYEELKRLRNQ
jgi:uncharacterized protein YaaR (DUF327 family)